MLNNNTSTTAKVTFPLSVLHLESFKTEEEANFFIDYMLEEGFACITTPTPDAIFVSVVEVDALQQKIAS